MYINTSTKEYPITKIVVPNVSLPRIKTAEILAEYGFAVVNDTEYPTMKVGRVITELTPVIADGLWVQSWGIDDSDVDSIGELRKERDAMLVLSDHTQAVDHVQVGVDTAAWAVYRQELRDLPVNTADPENITWPTRPILA